MLNADTPIFAYLLVKLAARCNLDCSYCYWFRDKTVYQKPIVLTQDAELALCRKLESHVTKYGIDEFTLLFHGGEPLLFGRDRFAALLCRLDEIGRRSACRFVFMLTTNGVLVDEGWTAIFQRFNVHVSVSLDGPSSIHDRWRRDFANRGSHGKAVRAIRRLQDAGRDPGVIAVCDPDTDPVSVVDYIVDDLGVRHLDILPPDATHDEPVKSIARYYTRLFDHWYDSVGPRGIEIRLLSGIVHGLLSDQITTDSIGFGPVHTVTVLTDGSLEALDVLRISQSGVTATGLNVMQNELQDVGNDPHWRRIYDASLSLASSCLECTFRQACGGGHLAHRWSKLRGFDNPSVYCSDWKIILKHIWDRVAPRVIVVHRYGESRLSEIPIEWNRKGADSVSISSESDGR